MEHESRQVVEILSDAIDEELEDEELGPHEEDEEHQDDGDGHVDVGEDLDALVQAGTCGQEKEAGHDRDDGYVSSGALGGDSEDVVQPGGDLEDRHTHGSGHTEDDGQGPHEVGEDLEPSLHGGVAGDVHDGGRDQIPLALAKSIVGHADSANGVDPPAVESPVERAVGHGHPRRLDAARVADGRGHEVGERLGLPPEEEPHAHTRREEHGVPGEVRELRVLFGVAQDHVAEPGEGQPHQIDQERRADQDVEPAEVLRHESADGLGRVGHTVLVEQGHPHEDHQDGQGHVEVGPDDEVLFPADLLDVASFFLELAVQKGLKKALTLSADQRPVGSAAVLFLEGLLVLGELGGDLLLDLRRELFDDAGIAVAEGVGHHGGLLWIIVSHAAARHHFLELA